jgi:hypothetical protein
VIQHDTAATVQRRILDRQFAAGRISEAEYRMSLQSFGLHDAPAAKPAAPAQDRGIADECFDAGVCPTPNPPADLAQQWTTAALLIMRGDPAGERLADELRAIEFDRYVATRKVQS